MASRSCSRHNPLSPKRKLTMDQRIMYLVTATHYLTGIAPGILLIVPALEIFFDLRPVNLDITWQTWLLFYAGFYLMQIVLAFYTLGSFRWEVLMLAAVSFPIYISALWNAIAEEGAEVARHRRQGESQVTVQLHDPAGAGLRLPAPDVGRSRSGVTSVTASSAWPRPGT